MSQTRPVFANGAGEPGYRFTLYVAGDTDLGRRAEANLRRIIESCLPRQYVLEVIDVILHPGTAVRERVTVTPMVVKTSPSPLRKVIGDFTDRSRVLDGLGIDAECPDPKQEHGHGK
jgi:circadian clock protein KaiB